MPSLKGRVAIVTGASRGIGRAIALGLARKRCDVVIAAKSTESTEKLPGSIFTVAAEVEAVGASTRWPSIRGRSFVTCFTAA